MDLESECSVPESVEDNEEITNNSVVVKIGHTNESKVQNNGPGVVENNDNNELFPEVKQQGTEVSGYVNSPPVNLGPVASPSPPMTRKGYGLKKWRRIKRDPNKVGDRSIDTGKMGAQDLSNSRVNSNSSKRMQYAERRQKSEGSVSSINAVVRSLDGFALLDDSGFGLGSPFAAGTESENSEDRSSKSSTAASAPRMKYEIPVMGFPHDKTKMRSLSGKNLMQSVHRGQQGKGRVETTKKARGDRVKIEKENSHSSVESDSRSSNFVFMQGTYSTNNGIRSERPKEYDGENGDEVQGQPVRDGHQGGYHRHGERGFGGLSHEDVDAESSWEVKEERSENHGSSRDQDPLVDSIFALQSAQEALEKELLKLKEVSTDSSNDDNVSDLCTEFTDVKQKLQKRSSDGLQHSEDLQSSSGAVHSEVLGRGNRDGETDLENLFRQKVEAEVEYLAISRTAQNLKIAALDRITVLEEQKALASEQAGILDKLGDTENKASMLKKEAEKLENFCEDIVSADETLKLHERVCKYSSCFLLQLVLLVVVLGIFVSKLSSNYVEVVPT